MNINKIDINSVSYNGFLKKRKTLSLRALSRYLVIDRIEKSRMVPYNKELDEIMKKVQQEFRAKMQKSWR